MALETSLEPEVTTDTHTEAETVSLPDGMFGRDEKPEPSDEDTSDDATAVASEEDDEATASGDDTSAAADEPSGQVDAQQSKKELAEQLGVDPDDYDSEEELLRFVRLMDRQAAKKLTKEEPEAKDAPKDEPAPKAESKAEVAAPVDPELGLDAKALLDGGLYDADDPILKIVAHNNALAAKVKELESKLTSNPNDELLRRLDSFETYRQEQEAKQFFHALHTIVDQWGDDKFGRLLDEQGRPGKLDQKFEDERQKLFEEMVRIEKVEEELGRSLNPTQLALRARLSLHPEDFKRQVRNEVLAQGKKQSKQRMGSPTGSRTASRSIANPADADEQRQRALLDEIEQIRRR